MRPSYTRLSDRLSHGPGSNPGGSTRFLKGEHIVSILALDVSGIPRTWVSHDMAIHYISKDLVAWSLGDVVAKYNGGYQRNGRRSYLEANSIIAVKGNDFRKLPGVILSNKALFRRDRHICAYCGEYFSNVKELSRDHIIPTSRGGEDTWSNCVTACVYCNNKKDNKLLKEARMELLYIPYEPSHAENLILQNRKILSDQMEYLVPMLPKHSRVFNSLATRT